VTAIFVNFTDFVFDDALLLSWNEFVVESRHKYDYKLYDSI